MNILLQNWMLWDSDILFRSALECATRLVFVSVAPPHERSVRIAEYTHLLMEVENIERSDKLRTAARNSADPATAMLLGGAALDPETEAELRARWPGSKRRVLKQQWSFSEIVRALEKVDDVKLNLTAYGSLLHSYSLSSHLIHADQTAITLMFDRETREPEERILQENAHFARLACRAAARERGSL